MVQLTVGEEAAMKNRTYGGRTYGDLHSLTRLLNIPSWTEQRDFFSMLFQYSGLEGR